MGSSFLTLVEKRFEYLFKLSSEPTVAWQQLAFELYIVVYSSSDDTDIYKNKNLILKIDFNSYS